MQLKLMKMLLNQVFRSWSSAPIKELTWWWRCLKVSAMNPEGTWMFKSNLNISRDVSLQLLRDAEGKVITRVIRTNCFEMWNFLSHFEPIDAFSFTEWWIWPEFSLWGLWTSVQNYTDSQCISEKLTQPENRLQGRRLQQLQHCKNLMLHVCSEGKPPDTSVPSLNPDSSYRNTCWRRIYLDADGSTSESWWESKSKWSPSCLTPQRPGPKSA